MHVQIHPGLIVLAALLGCGEPGSSTTSASGTSTTQGSTSSASSSTGTVATTDSGGTATQGPTTATSDPTSTATTATTSGSTTSGSGSTDGSAGTTASTSGSTTNESSTSGGTTTTASSTTGGSTTGSTTTESSTTGGVCQGDTESCANGETCCQGLICCEGVPVPPGQEFCAPDCPDSDRNLKTDIRPIDVDEVLARVVELDITTWRYKKDGADVRHLGPMAQDFRAAFGLWNTDTMIFPLDATGVSMAAIQGLHRRLLASEAENRELRDRMGELEQRLAALETGQRR